MRRGFVMGSSCALAVSLRVPAADWLSWPGFHRPGRLPPGAALPARLPDEPKALWRIKTGEGFASPVVAAGRVFLFDSQAGHEIFHALAAEYGREHWS